MNREDRDNINIFKHDIKEYSAVKIWNKIEKISLWKQRVYFRKLYDQALKELQWEEKQ